MFFYVFYDVPDDGLRNKIAEVLKDYGFERVQKSVFFGELTRNKVEELAMVLDDLIGDNEADVRIITVPPSFVDKVIVVRSMYGDYVPRREEVVVV